MLYYFLMVFFCSVHPVLESSQALYHYVYHSWCVWRWPVGLCDLWLHTLLPASCPSLIRSSKTSEGAYFILKLIKTLHIFLCAYIHVHSALHQKYHLNHHFRIQNKGFGITSTLWDHVFGTLPSTKTADKSTWVPPCVILQRQISRSGLPYAPGSTFLMIRSCIITTLTCLHGRYTRTNNLLLLQILHR
jgi:hypothetical protein